MKIIFWGSGNVAQRFIKRHEAFVKIVEVVGVTDSNEDKWHSYFENYNIFPPSVLLKQEYDYILILSSYFDEIKDNLLNLYDVSPRKIISIDDSDQIYVQKVHGSKNGYKFNSRLLLTEFAFSEKIYDKLLEQMDNMFYYFYLKEKYFPFIENVWNEFNYNKRRFEGEQLNLKENTPVWVCWLQGIENAPEIVKCCVNSIISNVEGKIHIITYNNYAKYVTISEHIIKKHRCGIISKTHFSDILRLALLCKYGGIWMDSTIFMMDKGLPDYIYKLPIFMYKFRCNMNMGYLEPKIFTNWFIKSEKENPVLNVLYKTLIEYWKEEKEYAYNLFHYVLRLIWDNYEIEEKYKNRLNIYDDRCRTLRSLLNKRYDEMLWNIMREEEPLQKLSYKNIGGGVGENKKTFYEYILENYRYSREEEMREYSQI